MDRRRDSAKARDGVAPFNSRGQKVPIFTAPRPRKESKTIGFGGVLWVLSVAGDRKYPAGGIYRHKGCAGRNPPATAFPWSWGRELRIATGAAHPRNDRGFARGAVGSLRCVGEGLCPSRGRPQGSPLRRGYKEYRGRGDVGIAPYGNACRGGRPCPPGPDNATPCRAGPVCPAGGGKRIPQPRLCRDCPL